MGNFFTAYDVTLSDLISSYKQSCEYHCTEPLENVLKQLEVRLFYCNSDNRGEINFICTWISTRQRNQRVIIIIIILNLNLFKRLCKQ